ncbi:hypothetical protein ACH4U6_28430 [Streptomyces netropsis]|uniref:hypothetical protein n=1 Tax=Streptomyces netropsis TaxID=55404 RepID=UPI0037B90274
MERREGQQEQSAGRPRAGRPDRTPGPLPGRTELTEAPGNAVRDEDDSEPHIVRGSD